MELVEIMIKTHVIGFLCLVILVACLVSSGCTTNQNTQGSAQNTPAQVTTPLQTTSSATTPVPTGTSMTPTSVPAAMVSATQNPDDGSFKVTLNSAEKKMSLGGGSPKPGNIILVLDVTIRNNDKINDFAYSDASFRILDSSKNGSWRPANTTQFGRGLNFPLVPGSIASNTEKTGQIAFVVSENSTAFKFSVVDSQGKVLTTMNTITVS
ncbi:MAG: DUF4352 domain-containing protein [Methanomicrobiales archaeon]